MGNQQGPTVYIAQGTLLNVMWWAGWEEGLRKNDICIHMAETLRYSPETITILLIAYTPILNKEFKKKT